MCGFAGFITADGGDLAGRARAMADTIARRGPDDSGEWADDDAGYAVAFRRLSIIDLSPLGHQPMVSTDGRYVIAYNGEVYNFKKLRAELESLGHDFRSQSDTEVILAAWSCWGGTETARRLIGMFAIAVWDRETRTLTLVRDRMGIKPLYWGKVGGAFLFGSELKALRAYPSWQPELDRDSVASFMRHVYIPGPMTVYKGVSKLEPGGILEVGPDGVPRLSRFWSLDDVVAAGMEEPLALSDGDATDRLEKLLGDAVEDRMVADVPLGAFLSGGIDSSTVVALMQARSGQPVRTFSIGFNEKGFNEAEHAKAVAEHLGTRHTELYITPEHALSVIPRLSDMYDEPFADSSQIPTFLVSELARNHVTVALSGDGGDELFAGYNRYLMAGRLWRAMKCMPHALRSVLARAMVAIPPAGWDSLASVLPASAKPSLPGDKMHKLAGVMGADSPDDLYRRIVTHWDAPEAMVPGAVEHKGVLWDEGARVRMGTFGGQMRYFDMLTYLPEDILTKVDRASMSVSLEARVPLLDHRVVEFAWKLPPDQLIRNGEGKWLLRQVLDRHVPKHLIERPKMGFGVPIDSWLRGPLRDWAEDLIDEKRLKDEGVLNPALIRARWREHLSGRRNWQYHLWAVLMFQSWRGRWLG